MLANLSQQAKDLTVAQGVLQALEARLPNALSSLNDMQADNGELKTNVGEVQQTLIELSATGEVLQESFASLSSMADLTSEVVQQNGDLSQRNSDALTTLRTEMVKQEEKLLGQAVADVAQINLVIDQLQTELTTLQRRLRVVGSMEQTAVELDERLYMTEQSMDSIITFRQETNRKLDQLANQIRSLQYQE